MGILRFLLAVAVVCWHSSPLLGIPIISGALAVKGFFVVSGFYMTLILSSKYERRTHSLWLFYSNRFLRIFPMYYMTLLGSLGIYAAAAIATGRPVDRLQYWVQAAHLGLWPELSLFVVAQIFILGIETSFFFVFNPGSGFSLQDLGPGDVPAWRFNFLPQAWTIGIELVFYMIVPFIIHLKKRYLAMIIALNLLVVVLLTLVWDSPLSPLFLEHFFPCEIGYFLLGILSFRLFYAKSPVPGFGSVFMNWIILGLVAVSTFSFGITGSLREAYFFQFTYVTLLFLGTSFLFQTSRNWAIDRFIGDLSYPMYLCHIPLRWLVQAAHGSSHRGDMQVSGLVLLPLTVFVSLLLVFLVDHPINNWRQKRIKQAQRASSSILASI